MSASGSSPALSSVEPEPVGRCSDGDVERANEGLRVRVHERQSAERFGDGRGGGIECIERVEECAGRVGHAAGPGGLHLVEFGGQVSEGRIVADIVRVGARPADRRTRGPGLAAGTVAGGGAVGGVLGAGVSEGAGQAGC